MHIKGFSTRWALRQNQLLLSVKCLLLLLFSRWVCQTLCDPMDCSLLCPSLSPGVCSNSCPLSWWCHPTISSSATFFSFRLLSFPASGSFPVSWLFTSDDQRTGTSASASVLPMNIQGWFPLGLIWFDLKSLLQHHNLKASILQCSD